MPPDNCSLSHNTAGGESFARPFLPTYGGETHIHNHHPVMPLQVEPQSRLRANTWPANRLDEKDEDEGHDGSGGLTNLPEEDGGECSSSENLSGNNLQHGQGVYASKKKNSARRNPWGNMSYADLIEKAIESVPDKRLTLSQIYDWLIQNVPYFKEKADTNSSAGWKNSVRHNLSLHNRFMRVQNETGTGKSSWWMVNQTAKFEKPSRRRAATLETKEYEKQRKGRLRQKPYGLLGEERNGEPVSSSTGENGSPFQLLRSRANSSASSYGCLSPNTPDQSPSLSPRSWSTGYESANGSMTRIQDFSFGFDGGDFSNHLAKSVSLNDARNGHGTILPHSPFEGTSKAFSGNQAAPAIGNYHPLSGINSSYPSTFNGSSIEQAVRNWSYGTAFPPIPEEPRQNPLASHFYPPRSGSSAGQQHNGSGMMTAPGNVSGGGFYLHNAMTGGHLQWSMPQDLDQLEPNQGFDMNGFDWEDIMRQEAVLERNHMQLSGGVPVTSAQSMSGLGAAHMKGVSQ